MTRSDSSHRDSTCGDWNVSLPSVVLHFGPLFIALSCLTLSLAGRSVYHGFADGDLGTSLSYGLMFVCLMLTIPAIRCGSLDRPRRATALLLSCIIALAMYDEWHTVHEDIGVFLQDNITWLPGVWLHYADDLLIILNTIAAALTLYWCLRKAQTGPELRPYVWLVVCLAAGHAVLDLLGHRTYVWTMVWPDIRYSQVYSEWQCMGFYEEWLKIWTEWFLVLFLLRFFHGQRGALLWSFAVFAGGTFATLGLWQVGSGEWGTPYLVTRGELWFVRNYHLLALTSWIWIGWAVMAWRLFRDDEVRMGLAGLFYLCPYYLLIPQLVGEAGFYRAFGGLVELVRPLFPFIGHHITTMFVVPFLVVPGILCGLSAAAAFRTLRGTVMAALGCFVLTSLCSSRPFGLSVPGPLCGGGLLPLAVLGAMVNEKRREAGVAAVLLASLLFVRPPLWNIAVVIVSFVLWLRIATNPTGSWSRRSLALLLGLHLLFGAALTAANPPKFIDNRKFSSGSGSRELLSIHYQPPK